MSEIEVRELKTKDLFTVARILLSLSDEATGEITDLVSRQQMQRDEGNEDNEEDTERQEKQMGMQIAINVVQIMLENAEDDLVEWFAELTDMNKDEFMEARIDAPMIVLNEISEQEGFVNFSEKAYSLYKKMNSSAEQLNES